MKPLLLALVVLAAPLASSQSSPSSGEPRVEQQLQQLVNHEREAQRVAQLSVRFNSIAENVSLTSDDPPAENAHHGLMNSPPHRANILGRDYNSIGIGAVRKGEITYITEDFARAFATLSTDDAERTVARALNDVRHKQHMPALRIVKLDALNQAACQPGMTLNRLLKEFSSSHGAVIFTTWDPEELPESLRNMLTDNVSTIALKACPLESAHGGSGGFKISVLFLR